MTAACPTNPRTLAAQAEEWIGRVVKGTGGDGLLLFGKGESDQRGSSLAGKDGGNDGEESEVVYGDPVYEGVRVIGRFGTTNCTWLRELSAFSTGLASVGRTASTGSIMEKNR